MPRQLQRGPTTSMPAILFERAHFGGFSLESPTTSRHIAYVTLLKRTVGPRVLSLSLQGSFEKIASLPLRFWHCFLFFFGFPSPLPLRFWHVIYIFFRESPLLRALRRCRSYTKRTVGRNEVHCATICRLGAAGCFPRYRSAFPIGKDKITFLRVPEGKAEH